MGIQLLIVILLHFCIFHDLKAAAPTPCFGKPSSTSKLQLLKHTHVTYREVLICVGIDIRDVDHPELEEPWYVVDDCAKDGAEDEALLQLDLLERVGDGKEPLDRHRERHEDATNASDVGKAITEKSKTKYMFQLVHCERVGDGKETLDHHRERHEDATGASDVGKAIAAKR